MPITSIRYSAEFNVNGLKRWVGAEATVPEGGNEDAELDLIIAFIDKTNHRIHGAFQPLQSGPQPQEPEVLPVQQVEKPQHDSIAEAIANCKNLTELLSYELLVKANQTWYELFNKRKMELEVIG